MRAAVTPTEALRAVYERGEACKECCFRYTVKDDGSTSDFGRGCTLIDHYPRWSEECPGVEDELARNEDERLR